MSLEFTTYVRKPFVVQVVEITRENIEEVATFVGDLKHNENGDPYILVDNRMVPSVKEVYLGFFMTRMGRNVRCFSRRIFAEQFMGITEEIQSWLDYLEAGD
jgi:hypothetical protein